MISSALSQSFKDEKFTAKFKKYNSSFLFNNSLSMKANVPSWQVSSYHLINNFNADVSTAA